MPREVDADEEEFVLEIEDENGYLIRGELKDVPKGYNCYELYKTI